MLMKKRISQLVVILCCTVLVGCSAKFVMIDRYGVPVPHEVVSIDSLYDISCTFYFVRFYEKSKESTYPEYLRMEKWAKLPKNTTNTALVVFVLNPRAEHIRIVKRLKLGDKVTKTIVYEGNGNNRTFQLKGPVDAGAKVELSADVVVKGLAVVKAGRALYTVRK